MNLQPTLLRLLLPVLLLLQGPFCAAADAPNLSGTATFKIDKKAGYADVTFSIIVKNKGGTACATNWFVDLWTEYPCACSKNPYQCATVGASDYSWEDLVIPAGKAVELTYTAQKAVSTMPYKFMIYIDSLGSCVESNEADNLVCGDYQIQGETIGADLIVENCSVGTLAENPTIVSFSATVTNVSLATIDKPVPVDFFLDLEPGLSCDKHFGSFGTGWFEVPAGLGPGQSVEVSDQVEGLEDGTYYPVFSVNGNREVAELLMTNNCCVPQDSFVFEPPVNWYTPDLTIFQFEASIEAGKLQFEGQVKNDGYKDLEAGQPFKLCIYKDWPTKPGFCEVPDPEKDEGWILEFSDGIKMGEELPFSLGAGKLTNGLHGFWARVDCDCQILEGDEKNNDFKQDLLVDLPGPDLVIDLFTAAREVSDQGVKIHYLVQLKNRGEDPVATPFDVDIFFDTPTLPAWNETEGYAGDYQQFAEGLAAGEKTLIHFYWTPPVNEPTRQYTAWAVVDIADNVFETSEENNYLSYSMVIESETTVNGKNLAVHDFISRVKGNEVEYYIEIENNGDGDILGNFRVDIYHDRETQPDLYEWGDQSDLIPGLAAGKTVSRWLTWKNDVGDGLFRAYVFVDVDNQIEELTEGDNVSGPRIAQVCAACNICEEWAPIIKACTCGDETVYTGFCCNGEWFAVGCPFNADGSPELEDDSYSADDGRESPGFGASGGCGCRHGGSTRHPGPSMFLSLLLLLGLRLAQKSTVPGKSRGTS